MLNRPIFEVEKIFKLNWSNSKLLSLHRQKRKSASEMEVLQVQTNMNEETRKATVDTLIAISVVARVLAEKMQKEGEKNEQDE